MTSKTNSQGESIDEAGVVTLAHGAGGLMTRNLIEYLVKNVAKKNLSNGVGLIEMDDGATVPIPGTEQVVVVTTDGHTVDPIFFPGGDLGKLAACGTANDVLMMNADPIALTHAIIVEEGFPIKDLKRINDSLVSTANEWGIAIIAGDTKVMPKGTLKGIISVTTGIGIANRDDIVVDNHVCPGDEIVVTGTLGDHGTAMLAVRQGLAFETELVSDVQVLANVVRIARKFAPRAMTDPTRGGLAVALNEIAEKSGVSIWIDEDKVPFQKATISACEMLGLNPYELASEGRAIIVVPKGRGEDLVMALRKLPESKDAILIGQAAKERPGKVLVRTRVGGTRILAMPLGEPIPRVC